MTQRKGATTMLTREEIERDMEQCKTQMGQIQGVFGYLQGKLAEADKADESKADKNSKAKTDKEVIEDA
jgi:hypothetical protein